MAAKSAKSSVRPDLASFAGLVIALGGILGGLVLEGGSIRDIAQVTAAMIVLGGTAGAVLISMPLAAVRGAMRWFRLIFFQPAQNHAAAIEEIISYATKARKSGLVSLDADAGMVTDPFLRKALLLAVDGTDIQEIRSMMELEMTMEEKRGEAEAKVYEAAGGYAPTIGIIGAVLGLIQVMKHIENVEEVGKGIAVAFVATVYGVGAANILFLPAASKIKAMLHRRAELRELMIEGVVGIVEGMNPKLIRAKLEAYTRAGEKVGKAPAGSPQRSPAPAAGAAPAQ